MARGVSFILSELEWVLGFCHRAALTGGEKRAMTLGRTSPSLHSVAFRCLAKAGQDEILVAERGKKRGMNERCKEQARRVMMLMTMVMLCVGCCC